MRCTNRCRGKCLSGGNLHSGLLEQRAAQLEEVHHRREIADPPHVAHLAIGQVQFEFGSDQAVGATNTSEQVIGLSDVLHRTDFFHYFPIVTRESYQAVGEEFVFFMEMVAESSFQECRHWSALPDQRTIDVVTDLVAE